MERVGQAAEDRLRERAAGAELDDLGGKLRFVVTRRRPAIAGHQRRSERIEGDVAGRVEHTGPELDRRDVPLPHGAQAHDEPPLAGPQTRLVGRRDDGRIEESGAFDGVFVGEVGADEQAARAGQDGVAREVRHQLEVALEEALEVPVTRAKLFERSLEHDGNVGLGEREDACQQQAGARRGRVVGDLLAGKIGFGDDAARIVAQHVRGSSDHVCAYSKPSPASSSISASDNRNAMVLSAP